MLYHEILITRKEMYGSPLGRAASLDILKFEMTLKDRESR